MKNQSMKKPALWILSLALFCLTLNLSAVPLLQDPITELFSEVEATMAKAKAASAEIYSPGHFDTAMKNYNRAKEDFQKGKNREDIEKKVKMSNVYFLKSIETVLLAQTHFEDCISARNDALAAEAPTFRKDGWKDAEAVLNQAARTLEDGNLDGAKSKARKAERLYRQVELEAIKANFLDKTHALFKKAEDLKVKKRAPQTLEKAQKLAAQAEKQLMENRYDTDEARQIAREARYEAEHALYISSVIDSLERDDVSLENQMLHNEHYLQSIANTLDLPVLFNQGLDIPTRQINVKIKKLQQKISMQNQDLADKQAQIDALAQQVNSMESKLGDLKDKEETLSQLVKQQEMLKEKYARVEKSFQSNEAQVLRSGNKVIIRLYGLSFPVGKSTIETQYFGLLKKVEDAIAEYPESGVTVEGHTDSRGGDATNQKLSTERAEAVREYLLASSKMDAARVIAVGYGESKPIGTNDTEEGRRKNRRIDVIIHPKN